VKKIRVLLADNHTIVRQGLRKILEADKDIRVIEQASNGFEAIEKTKTLLPDIVVMDLKMPEMSGAEATMTIKRDFPSVGVVILSMFGDDVHIRQAISAGADSYLLKDNSADELVKCIKDVHRGESFITSDVARKILNSEPTEKASGPSKTLTVREKEVLVLLARGRSNTQIAESLYISENTVRNHISNIYEKLDCNSRAQAAMEAVKRGIVDLIEQS
jgi:DNA-binding NarL/FixJ family response regulator